MKQWSQRFADYEWRVRTALKVYAAWCAAVLVMTLITGTRDNVLTVSMSAMGNSTRSHYFFFIAWTIVFCSYFASLMGFNLILARRARSRIRVFVYLAVAIMIFGDIAPFVPDRHPFFAFLHNTCAQISSLSLAFSLMLLTLTVRHEYSKVYKRAILWVILIWCLLLVGMALIGTKALTEMTGVVGGSVFLLFFAWDIAKQDHFSASQVLSASDALEAEEEAEKLEKRARELQEDYLKADEKARAARRAADYLRRVEARQCRKTPLVRK